MLCGPIVGPSTTILNQKTQSAENTGNQRRAGRKRTAFATGLTSQKLGEVKTAEHRPSVGSTRSQLRHPLVSRGKWQMSDSKCPSLPSFGIMRICSYSLEPKFVDKESGGWKAAMCKERTCLRLSLRPAFCSLWSWKFQNLEWNVWIEEVNIDWA